MSKPRGSGMLTFWLRREVPEHWAYMPHVLGRVQRFCKAYASIADPKVLTQQAMNHFAAGSPLVAAFVLLDDGNGQIVGHVLCETTDWAGSRYAIILQYELDAVMPEADRIRGFQVVEEWAQHAGAWGVQIFARTPAHARAFRRYGLGYEATLMRKGNSAQPSPQPSRDATIPAGKQE